MSETNKILETKTNKMSSYIVSTFFIFFSFYNILLEGCSRRSVFLEDINHSLDLGCSKSFGCNNLSPLHINSTLVVVSLSYTTNHIHTELSPFYTQDGTEASVTKALRRILTFRSLGSEGSGDRASRGQLVVSAVPVLFSDCFVF